jgi:hypothetical protein
MALTARSAIRRALLRLNAVGATQTVKPQDEQDAYAVLRAMMSGFNARRLLGTVGVRSPYTLVNGTGSYTVGATGTLVGERPNEVDAAMIVPSGQSYEQEMRVLTRQEWNAQTHKSQSGEPWAVHYEPTATNGTLYVLWVPNRNASIVLYHKLALTTFADLTTEYSFADGVEELIELQLTVRVAALFQKVADQVTLTLAAMALGNVMADAEANDVPQLVCDAPLSNEGIFDPVTGEVS